MQPQSPTTEMPAARRPGDFEVPLPVRGALEQVFGEPVDRVKVIENSWFARLHGDVLATTRRDRIYLNIGGAEFLADRRLILHEYFHVIRQWNTGRLTTPGYVVESMRRGYWNNRFEVEARRFADENLDAFNQLLGR